MNLILASHSAYKRHQLLQLGLDFQSIAAGIDEDHKPNSDIETLAQDLAFQKANAVFNQHPSAVVIGSDQTAVGPDKQLLTKPLKKEKAIAQLLSCSGKSATFFSAVSLISSQGVQSWSVKTQVAFRRLNIDEITRYIEKDQPLDCAGSFKVESLGISLFRDIKSTDPSALIGLPLISLAQQLRHLGLQIP